MEALLLLLAAVLLATPIGVFVLWQRQRALTERLQQLEQRLRQVQRERDAHGAAAVPVPATTPPPQPAPAPLPRPAEPQPPLPEPWATPQITAPPAEPPPLPTFAALDAADAVDAAATAEPATATAAEPGPAPPPLPADAGPPHRAPRDIETEIGTRWLVLAGAGALFLGVVFLLKWSFDRGLFGPLARVVGGAVLGLALWTAAWLWRERYRLLAHGFAAAGSCVLYASIWAAHMRYELLPHGASFAALVLLSGITLFAAARLPALPLAVLALLGGFATPALLPAPSTGPHALLAYATVLVLAALLLRWLRQWPQLSAIALSGTALLMLGWSADRGTPEHTPALLAWGTWFSALFLVGGCGPSLWHRRAQVNGDLLTAAASPALWLLLVIATEAWTDSSFAGLLAAVQAALFAIAAMQQARRAPDDRRGRETLWLLAAVLVAATAPLWLREHALTAALALISLLLMHGGRRLPAPGVAIVGAVALGWAILRVVALRLEALPLQWRGDPEIADTPFARLSCWVELLVIAVTNAVGSVEPRWRTRGTTAAAVLLLPLLAGELMGFLVAHRWPHEHLGFDRAVAWAWPAALLALAAGLLRPTTPAHRTAVAGFGAFAGLMTLLAVGIPTTTATPAWFVQFAARCGPIALVALGVRGALPEGAAPTAGLPLTALLLLHAMLLQVGAELLHLWHDEAAALPLLLAAGLHFGLWASRPEPVQRRELWQLTVLVMLLAPACRLLLLLPAMLATTAPSPDDPEVQLARTALPLALLWMLPPMALLRLRRSERPVWRAAAELGAAIAIPFALLGWCELERHPLTRGDIVFHSQPDLALLLPASLLVVVLVAGPGSLRGDHRARVLPLAALLTLWLLLGREGWSLGERFSADPEQGAQAGLSISWALCAAAALAIGIAARLPLLRVLALCLFGLTLGKLVLIDLAALPLPYRVLSFLVLGLLLMGGGFLYHRFAARISARDGASQP